MTVVGARQRGPALPTVKVPALLCVPPLETGPVKATLASMQPAQVPPKSPHRSASACRWTSGPKVVSELMLTRVGQGPCVSAVRARTNRPA